MEKQLLITGFEPFGGSDTNTSWMAVEQLPNCVGSYILHKLKLPTIYGEAARMVLTAANRLHPNLILCVGMAAGRSAITPERIGVNIQDARIPDNAGKQPHGERIIPDGPAAYFSTAPIQAITQAINAQQLPSVISNTAGTFVCNDLLYTLLHHFHQTDVQVGFIHVPSLPSQSENGLPLTQIVTALIAAINAC